MLRRHLLARVFAGLLPNLPVPPQRIPIGLVVQEWAIVGMAAWRLAWWFPRRPLAELVGILRRGRPLPVALAQPTLQQWFVDRFLHRLPPQGMGPCLKRSLLLFHLFSRCGLNPQLHLGVVIDSYGRSRGHAWVSAQGFMYGAPTGQADRVIEFGKSGQLGAF